MEETPKVETSKVETPKKAPVNVMAVISYIGPLCLIPILTKEKDEFVQFHAKQGLVLFIGEVAMWLVVGFVPILWVFANLVNLFWLVLSIIGIINVTKNEKKEIPLVGQFAAQIKI
jgi:uncharacterized membrane protein